MKSIPFSVVIECCQNCSTHSWCSRHQSHKYDQHFAELKRKLQSELPSIIVTKNLLPSCFRKLPSRVPDDTKFYNEKTGEVVQYPRVGAFQVYSDGYLIFSKIESHLWPCHNRMIALVERMYHDKIEGREKQLGKYALQNRIYYENDQVFKVTYNRLLQKEFLDQKPSRMNSSLQRSNVANNSNNKLELTPQLKKGIKIRKIGSSSGKKIEPLSYNQRDKKYDDFGQLEVGHQEGLGHGKYIRPIAKYRKEFEEGQGYGQVKGRKRLEEEKDLQSSQLEEQQSRQNDLKYKRPVRVIRKVIDTKIDQKKPKLQQLPPSKIPKIEPIKIFPHDTNPLPSHNHNHTHQKPIPQQQSPPHPPQHNSMKNSLSSNKVNEQDEYEQLYDEEEEKQKREKERVKSEEIGEVVQDEFELGGYDGERERNQKGNKKIVGKLKNSGISENVEEEIGEEEEIVEEKLKRSTKKGGKGRRKTDEVEEMVEEMVEEGIDEELEDESEGKRKEQLRRQQKEKERKQLEKKEKEEKERKEKQRKEEEERERDRIKKEAQIEKERLEHEEREKERIKKDKEEKEREQKEEKEKQIEALKEKQKRLEQERREKEKAVAEEKEREQQEKQKELIRQKEHEQKQEKELKAKQKQQEEKERLRLQQQKQQLQQQQQERLKLEEEEKLRKVQQEQREKEKLRVQEEKRQKEKERQKEAEAELERKKKQEEQRRVAAEAEEKERLRKEQQDRKVAEERQKEFKEQQQRQLQQQQQHQKVYEPQIQQHQIVKQSPQPHYQNKEQIIQQAPVHVETYDVKNNEGVQEAMAPVGESHLEKDSEIIHWVSKVKEGDRFDLQRSTHIEEKQVEELKEMEKEQIVQTPIYPQHLQHQPQLQLTKFDKNQGHEEVIYGTNQDEFEEEIPSVTKIEEKKVAYWEAKVNGLERVESEQAWKEGIEVERTRIKEVRQQREQKEQKEHQRKKIVKEQTQNVEEQVEQKVQDNYQDQKYEQEKYQPQYQSHQQQVPQKSQQQQILPSIITNQPTHWIAKYSPSHQSFTLIQSLTNSFLTHEPIQQYIVERKKQEPHQTIQPSPQYQLQLQQKEKHINLQENVPLQTIQQEQIEEQRISDIVEEEKYWVSRVDGKLEKVEKNQFEIERWNVAVDMRMLKQKREKQNERHRLEQQQKQQQLLQQQYEHVQQALPQPQPISQPQSQQQLQPSHEQLPSSTNLVSQLISLPPGEDTYWVSKLEDNKFEVSNVTGEEYEKEKLMVEQHVVKETVQQQEEKGIVEGRGDVEKNQQEEKQVKQQEKVQEQNMNQKEPESQYWISELNQQQYHLTKISQDQFLQTTLPPVQPIVINNPNPSSLIIPSTSQFQPQSQPQPSQSHPKRSSLLSPSPHQSQNSLIPIPSANQLQIRPINSTYQFPPISPKTQHPNIEPSLQISHWQSKPINGQYLTVRVIQQVVQNYLTTLLSPSQINTVESVKILEQGHGQSQGEGNEIEESHVIRRERTLTEERELDIMDSDNQFIKNNTKRENDVKHQIESSHVIQQISQPELSPEQEKVQLKSHEEHKDLEVLQNMDKDSMGWRSAFRDGEWMMVKVE